MRTLTSIIAISLISFSVTAQDCRVVKDEIDPITKEREVVVKTRPVVGAWFVAHNKEFHVEWELHTTSVESIIDGAAITLLFDDDTTLPLVETGSEISEYVANLNWRLDGYSWITMEELQKMASKRVKMIRWGLTDHDHDKDYNAKMGDELQRAAHCLLTTVAPEMVK